MLNSPAWAVLSLNRALHQRAHLFENTKSEHDDLCPTNTTKRAEKKMLTAALLLLEKVRKQQLACVCVCACVRVRKGLKHQRQKQQNFVATMRCSKTTSFAPSLRTAHQQG